MHHRKLKTPWPAAEPAIQAFSRDFNTYPAKVATIARATRRAQRYPLAWFDALREAAALECGGLTLYREGLRAGRVFGGQLHVANPCAT